jgi:Zn-dependent protease with chaperone function
VAYDPINAVDLGFLRRRSAEIHQALLGNLQPAYLAKVRSVPLVFDEEVGAVNAYAACSRTGESQVAITDGLLDISAHLAQCRATDDLFRTQKVDEYIQFVARYQQPQRPIVRPATGFFLPSHHADARKVQRQHQIFDEIVAFILAHELAHHYLNHLPCTAQGGIGAGNLARVLSGAVPVFNQPNEVAADVSGIQNVLLAGSRQSGYRWTEEGGLLSMRFFSGLDRFSPIDILFAFESSHPPPQLRVPIVRQTASSWRALGGRSLPLPAL